MAPAPKKGIIQEFKEFALRGNVMDLAVGVIIGGAFGKIVTSLVNDIFTPILSKITGGINFATRFVSLDGKAYTSVDAAKAANAPVLTYGIFIQNVIDFILIAIVIFGLIKLMNRLFRRQQKKQETAPVPSAEQRLLTEIRDILKRKPL